MAIASRTPTPSVARAFMAKLGEAPFSVGDFVGWSDLLRQSSALQLSTWSCNNCDTDDAPTAGLTDLFESAALIPASSGFDHTSAQKDTAHFPRIQNETGVRYERMLFFDDEHKNAARVRPPGFIPRRVRQVQCSHAARLT